jgi:hypothetical protein
VSQSTTITTEIKQDEINAEDRKKMNFAWSVAILSASGPSETKPDKDKVIKSTNKTTD